MRRLHLVSNRLPVTVAKGTDGSSYKESVGGVATGLKGFHERGECVWTGWCGLPTGQLAAGEQHEVAKRLGERACNSVFLTEEEIRLFYEGFCNKTIWPHFHYFNHLTVYDQRLWEAYCDVNRRFCDALLPVVEDGDSVWMHDYHLLLLPHMLRNERPRAKIGFFLHIPFPSFEIFRLLPWRQELLEGMLGADLVGFHTYEYARHFFSCLRRILGCEPKLGEFDFQNRLVKVDVFPMGIDYGRYAAGAGLPEVRAEIEKIREQLGDTRIILSIDRLDYTKGLPARLASFDRFLHRYPEVHGKITLFMIEVPSRTGVDSYVDLKSEVDQWIGEINGRHSSLGWAPIHYLASSHPFETLCALYYLADAALVTPIRDGMNLVAKEFVASYRRASSRLLLLDYDGTLIPFAAKPERAVPDDGLLVLLRQLGMDEKNTVTILSGRDRSFLERHFGDLPVNRSAEHGAWLRPAGGEWEQAEYVGTSWKDEIRPLLESYVDRTPGTSLEEKDFSLAWHYRRADSELAAQRQSELREDLLYFTANSNLAVMEGNKVLEVKSAGATKGAMATRLVEEATAEFVFAIGDDVTDEDTFASLPETAVTVKVGLSASTARLNVKDVPAARRLLLQLAAIG